MTFEQAILQFSREIVYLAEIDAKVCSHTFGTSLCLATGEPCYNTYSTCKYKSAFDETTRTDVLCSVHRDPFPGETVRDYLKRMSYNPTEIGDAITTTARVTITFSDVMDNDAMMDKYVSQRSYDPEDQSSFWRKYFRRHKDYKGYEVRISVGTLELARAD